MIIINLQMNILIIYIFEWMSMDFSHPHFVFISARSNLITFILLVKARMTIFYWFPKQSLAE